MTQRAFEFHTEPPREPTLDERAEAFHRANPEVFALMVKLARAEYEKGATRIGAKALYERMRWELGAGAKDGSEYRLNNSWVSWYVRLIDKRYPELGALFQKRRRPSEGRKQ